MALLIFTNRYEQKIGARIMSFVSMPTADYKVLTRYVRSTPITFFVLRSDFVTRLQ